MCADLNSQKYTTTEHLGEAWKLLSGVRVSIIKRHLKKNLRKVPVHLWWVVSGHWNLDKCGKHLGNGLQVTPIKDHLDSLIEVGRLAVFTRHYSLDGLLVYVCNERKLSSNNHYFLLPDCGCNGTGYVKHLLHWLPTPQMKDCAFELWARISPFSKLLLRRCAVITQAKNLKQHVH